jgi:hypothetical protein
MGTIDFNARHVVKIGTDTGHMVETKAALDVVLYLTSLLDLEHKAGSSVEQLLQQIH